MLRKWAPYYFYHLWTRVRCCIVVGEKSFSHTHFPWLGWHMNRIILIKITDVCSTFLPLLHIIIIIIVINTKNDNRTSFDNQTFNIVDNSISMTNRINGACDNPTPPRDPRPDSQSLDLCWAYLNLQWICTRK